MSTKHPRLTKRRTPIRATPKPRVVRRRPDVRPVEPDAVTLTRTKGTSERGGGPGGEAWRIEAQGKRAGVVFINVIDESPIGPHASIQIYLNAASQGQHIGRVAYRKACEASVHDLIYAHMRKTNLASRRAAEEAGFSNATPPGYPQLIMKRNRGTP
jgi:RimJ/RimL family protein N-acetyltransferase